MKHCHKLFRALPALLLALCITLSPAAAMGAADPDPGRPVARDLTVTTYTDLALCARLEGMGGQGPLSFALMSPAKRGTVEFLEGGLFLYTPEGRRNYTDHFTYLVCDSQGNRSAVATVTVEVKKREGKACLRYTDMENNPAHYAAVRLAEEGILRGEQIGPCSFFQPQQPVTRAEFVTMMASVCQLPTPTAAIGTGMQDDAAIPAWARGSVVAAISQGIIQGGKQGTRAVFRSQDAITRAEAAAILDRALELSDDSRVMHFPDQDQVPVWARQVLVNTACAGILPLKPDGSAAPAQALTREEAAQMLHGALCFLEQEETPVSLLRWLLG